ncbi:MAG: outer membrane protein assembly factor BamD [Acidobacteriota bacterium]|jgi:outer membrane protein assembly factor BamD|nr:outer membrane protein assembly factor BamD [Acidobacteriota bacterium]
MRFRNLFMSVLCAALLLGALPARALRAAAAAQQQQQQSSPQSQLSPMQRLDVMRSRLETMRRTLNSAIAGLNAKDKGGQATADDPRARLGGLEKEAGKLYSEVTDLRGKQERAERYDTTQLDKLEAAIAELDTRMQSAMRDTMSERSAAPTVAAATTSSKGDKKKGGFFGRILGHGGDAKYDELVGTVAPGRDRELFEEATKQARHDSYETARSLYSVIINTYPDSVYLPLAKLAIADTFYLEGTTSALIQAGQAYQDWYTFFPTHPLSDDVCLKQGEVEMRRMGLANRDISPARKAEQRLKVCLQQFPKSSLRPEIEIRLSEVQESLADHDKGVGDQYFNKFYQHRANNLKGAQSRYREVYEKYKNYTGMAELLYRYATTYMEEEEPDEATKYFQELVRKHPNSDYADKAKEKLAAIGAQVPDPDPDAVKEEPKGPGMIGGMVREIGGIVQKTVNKDGVIISQSSKGNDIIEAVISNDGKLPDNYNTAPLKRTAPAHDVRPLPTAAPAKKEAGEKKEVSLEPTRPGAPQTGSDPARPAATQTTTPATPPPTGAKP